MSAGSASALLRHPVLHRLCAPAAAVAGIAAVVLRAMAELHPRGVADALQLTTLLLALATVTARAAGRCVPAVGARGDQSGRSSQDAVQAMATAPTAVWGSPVPGRWRTSSEAAARTVRHSRASCTVS